LDWENLNWKTWIGIFDWNFRLRFFD
jgi:hypothetical protein